LASAVQASIVSLVSSVPLSLKIGLPRANQKIEFARDPARKRDIGHRRQAFPMTLPCIGIGNEPIHRSIEDIGVRSFVRVLN
jgi:hypothetical protein